ncbi:MAG: PQQ-dependent sugar dehydrogenase [Actinomycetes bacterium]
MIRPSRRAVLLAVALMASAGCAASGTGRGLVAIGSGLQGPSGLSAMVYATGLAKAAAFAFDESGRLWVATADSTDRGDDGVYLVAGSGAAPVPVITGLHTPLGLLWEGGSLYVAQTGGVEAYSGFDGSHFAQHRTVVSLPAGAGESNELALGPDGRIRMGISAPCDHCTPASRWSATVVSFRPDGSGLAVDASGIRAPVGLIYFPGTSDLFVTMNQRDDLGPRTPGDWLAVVRSGQAWGFPGCWGQGGTPCTGVPAPVAVLDKHAAVSGITVVTGQLGRAVGTSAIVAEWATGKVQRIALERSRSGYRGTVTPLLRGLKNPVAVSMAADGSLFVGDWSTGTVYRITRS